jgi:hypothetical protein
MGMKPWGVTHSIDVTRLISSALQPAIARVLVARTGSIPVAGSRNPRRPRARATASTSVRERW